MTSSPETSKSTVKRIVGNPWLQLALRLLVGGTMLFYGAKKIGEPPKNFLKAIREYRMFPESAHVAMNVTAVALPWVESACGIALIAGVFHRGAALLITLMNLVFAGGIYKRAMTLAAENGKGLCGQKFDCGCGLGETWVCPHLLFNLALIVLSLLILVAATRKFQLLPMKTPSVALSPSS